MHKILFLAIFSITSSFCLAETTPPSKEVACRACHGVNGETPITPNYPKLNGQNKEYLVSSLKAYRGGKRLGALAGAMTAQASQLSDQDIEELSAYYAAQK